MFLLDKKSHAGMVRPLFEVEHERTVGGGAAYFGSRTQGGLPQFEPETQSVRSPPSLNRGDRLVLDRH